MAAESKDGRSPASAGSGQQASPSTASAAPQSAVPNAVGFGGRTFTAKGSQIFVEPLRREHADGSAGTSLGFPFATLSDFVGKDEARELAEYLSSPVRAAAPDPYEALKDAKKLLSRPRYMGDPADRDRCLAKIDAALAQVQP